jgi:hypothetical protein
MYCSSSGLIVIISEGALDNENCVHALKVGVQKKCKIVIVWDTTCKFPQYSKIKTLSTEVQGIFSSIAVPLIKEYAKNCWEKVADKLFNRIKVNLQEENPLSIACRENELVSQPSTIDWSTHSIKSVLRTQGTWRNCILGCQIRARFA